MVRNIDLFGWELLYRTVEKDLKKKEDVLTLLIHFSLIKSGFKCLGVGETTNSQSDIKSSETLPDDWNKDTEVMLRYIKDKDTFLLQSIHTELKTVVYNLVQANKLKATNVMFSSDDSVAGLKGTIGEILPGYRDMLDSILKNLIIPYTDPNSTDAPCLDNSVKLREPVSRRFDDEFPDNEFGRSDLDPFGAVYGQPQAGMLYDPFSLTRRGRRREDESGFLPSGSIPPGARFDPFGPSLPRGPSRKDFPPDMFC